MVVSRLGRIRWQCRRGKLELDIILQPFLDQELSRLSSDDVARFEELLQLPDDRLLACLTGVEPAPQRCAPLVARIRNAAAD